MRGAAVWGQQRQLHLLALTEAPGGCARPRPAAVPGSHTSATDASGPRRSGNTGARAPPPAFAGFPDIRPVRSRCYWPEATTDWDEDLHFVLFLLAYSRVSVIQLREVG